MGLVHINEQNFKKEILEEKNLALVDFYADWCAPCKILSPVIEELSNEYEGRLKAGKLNVEEAGAIATRYSIMSIPTLLFFKDGQIIEQIVGALPKQQLKAKIETLLK